MNDQTLLSCYPYNLLNVIFESNEDKIFRVHIPSFFTILHTGISIREKNVIEYRYINKYTLKQIGEIYNVTGARIGQIEKKAIRKLRHPSRSKHYLFDVENEAYNKGYEAGLSKGFYRGIAYSNSELSASYPYNIKPIPIEELDLSVRTYNCLRRIGIKNIVELSQCDINKLRQTRNLGKKSFDELVEKAKQFGIYILDKEAKEQVV